MTIELSIEEIRTFLVRCQMLDHYRSLDESGLVSVFDRLGCIQYDTLNVVGRNPCLVLQSRLQDFKVDLLNKYIYEDCLLIDGWDKEMSIYQRKEWPFYARIRNCYKKSVLGMLEYRGQLEALKYTEVVLNEIQKNGALSSKQLNLGKSNSTRWGNSNVSGIVMNYLFASGRVGIKNRDDAIKIYSLIEDLLPQEVLYANEPFECDEDFYEWYFLRRIAGLGMCWLRNGGGWNGYFLEDKELRKNIISNLEQKGLITSVNVPEINETLFMRSSDISLLNNIGQDGNVRFLAPLDNLLWDRGLLEKIFGFKYSWEVYLPASKRKYGYYVIPVLYKNRIVARMEPEKQKNGKSFIVKNWWWEKDISIDNDLKDAILLAMKRFAKYVNADGYSKDNEKIIFP